MPKLANMKTLCDEVQVGLKQHSMSYRPLDKKSAFLSETEILTRAITAAMQFMRKVKNLHKNVMETVENLAKPDKENCIRSIQNIIQLSQSIGTSAALRLFALRPSVRSSTKYDS